MKNILGFLFPFAIPLFWLADAQAALNPAVVPADSRWVIYSDLNALRASVVGKELVAIAEKAQLSAHDLPVGIDIHKLLATIGTVTAYGTNFSKEPKAIDGTLILQGTPDLRKIAEALVLQATITEPTRVSEIKDLPFTAYSISPSSGKSPEPMELIVAFPPEPVVLVSKSRPQLLRARDVLLGKASSVAKATSSPLGLLLKSAEKSFLFAATVVPSEQLFPTDGPQARILQMANSGSIALGESGEQTFAHVELVASTEAMAEKLMKILEGVTAMMSLAETTDKQLAEFLNSTNVSRNGSAVALNLSYSSARLVQMVQTLSQVDHSPTRQPPPITIGKAVAEWGGELTGEHAASGDGLNWRTINNVSLVNGATITLGRQPNGGKHVQFDRVEILPAQGQGAPLVFGRDFMKSGGNRNFSQFQFPGADGLYSLRVGYSDDSDGRARFAVSIRDPKPAPIEAK